MTDNGNQAEKSRDQLRKARVAALSDVAVYVSRAILNLGPCFSVTVGFSAPGPIDGQAETYSFTSWFDDGMGAAHLAELSDRLNEQHVKVQANLDRLEEERRKEEANEGALRSTEGDTGGPQGRPGGGAEEREKGEPDGR